MKKGIGSVITLGIVLVGAYFLGGLELVFEIAGIDIKAPIIDIDELPSEVEYMFDFTTLEIGCEDNMDEICDLEIEGTLIADTLGLNTVTFKATDTEGNSSEVNYTYEVVDTTAPVINVMDIPNEVEYLFDFTTYTVDCEDNYDETCEVETTGSLDSTELGETTITYSATDTEGNNYEVSYTYTVVDTTAPELNMSNLIPKLQLNADVVPTCTDNYDATCTVVFDAIDTSTLGETSVVLTVTDSNGNTSSYTYLYEVIVGLDTTMYVPDGYYDSIDGLTGSALQDALNLIITDHTEYPYTSTATDVWDILRDADEDPDNPDNIIMFYTGVSHPKDCQDTVTPPAFCEANLYGESKLTEWNREHIWSKSRGSFADDDFIAHNDTHHLVAAERVMNSTKNNRYFEDCHDGDDTNVVDRGYGNYTCNGWEFEPRDEVKGDVARMLFYMATRYQGDPVLDDGLDLVLANDPDDGKDLHVPIYGDIDDLLRWHLEDPVDQWEIDRNEVIYGYQGNRNPFIDHPELVELIWGTPEDYN